MEASSFSGFVDKYLRPVANQWPTRVNDSRLALTYLFKTMLTPKYSPTHKWKSFGANTTVVMADYVARNSELSLKKRDSMGTFEGNIPKQGMKLHMTEDEENDLMLLEAAGGTEAQVAQELKKDVEKVISGVWEANEDVFLRLLSDGLASIDSDSRPGLSLRLTINVADENRVKASKKWSTDGTVDVTAPVIDDMHRHIDFMETKGDKINFLAMTNIMVSNIAKTNQGRQLYANFAFGKADPDIAKVAIPTRKKMIAALEDEFEVKIINTTRTVRAEKDGVQTQFKPFSDTNITYLTTEQVGTLWYGNAVEARKPAAGVSYATSDSYINVSMYRDIEPYLEVTRSQAVVIPMLDNVNSIYWFNTTEVVPAPTQAAATKAAK